MGKSIALVKRLVCGVGWVYPTSGGGHVAGGSELVNIGTPLFFVVNYHCTHSIERSKYFQNELVWGKIFLGKAGLSKKIDDGEVRLKEYMKPELNQPRLAIENGRLNRQLGEVNVKGKETADVAV